MSAATPVPVRRILWGKLDAEIQRNWGAFIIRDIKYHPFFRSKDIEVVVKYVTTARTLF